MDLRNLAAQARVTFLLGKGGVGKTTVTAAMARALADEGSRVLVIELEGRPEVGRAFGLDGELDYAGRRLYEAQSGGFVAARRVTPDEALLEYLDDHSLGRLSRRLLSAGMVDVVAGAIPGIREVLLLGKIKQIANEESELDLILVDAPATGHAVTLLTSPAGVSAAARGGPVRSQADQVVEMLEDPARAAVILVTIPEELPVTETVEAAFRIEDEAGLALAAVIANRVEPPRHSLEVPAAVAASELGVELDAATLATLDEAARFQRAREVEAARQRERLRTELPLPLLVLPRVATAAGGPAELDLLAAALRHAAEQPGVGR